MIFDIKEVYCVLEVLRILGKKETRYSQMFKQTKVSHTTLQKVLRGLAGKGIIKKHDIGHMNVKYEITNKGRRFLACLNELESLLK